MDAALREGIRSEKDVVYILVELRKFLEAAGLKGRYKSLTFFCDWVVHPKLSGTQADEIVHAIDKMMDNYHKTNTFDSRQYEGYLRLSSAAAELRTFLALNGLPTNICDYIADWSNFLTFYLEVVSDCQLECTAKNQNTRHIDKLMISTTDKGTMRMPDGSYLDIALIRWELSYKGSPILSWITSP